jgi:hypothetical protein
MAKLDIPNLRGDESHLVDEAGKMWKAHQPVAASLWGPLVLDNAEDLSEKGLADWRSALAFLQDRVDKIRQNNPSPLGRIVLEETQAFLHHQQMQHVVYPIYKTQAMSYLRLCAFGLLPFYLTQKHVNTQAAEMVSSLKSRLSNCIEWIEWLLARAKAGEINVRATDRHVAAVLSAFIQEWQTPHQDLRNQLDERLGELKDLPESHTQPKLMSINPRKYARDVLGIQQPLENFIEPLLRRLRREADKLGRTLDEQLPGPEPQNRATSASVDENVADNIAWARLIEREVRKRVARQVLAEVGPSARIVSCPSLLEPFAKQGLYLPPTAIGERPSRPGWLLMSRELLRQSPSDLVRAQLVLQIAHELCPGHDEHFRRGNRSPFAALFEITRSNLGLEGWGFLAESTALRMKDMVREIDTAVYLERVRRLAFAVRYLMRICMGSEKSRQIASQGMTNALSGLPEQEMRRILDAVEANYSGNWTLISYAIGLLETEGALQKLKAVLGLPTQNAAILETYLGWGPIRPDQVSVVVEHVNANY